MELKTICNVWWSRKLLVLLVHHGHVNNFIFVATYNKWRFRGLDFGERRCMFHGWLYHAKLVSRYEHILLFRSSFLSLPLTFFSYSFAPILFPTFLLFTCTVSPHTPLSLPLVLSLFLAVCCLGNNNSFVLFFHFLFMNYQVLNLFVHSHSILKLTFKRNKTNVLIFND